MNKKILNRIAELMKQRNDQIREANEQLNNTREELRLTKSQLEDAYLSGDAENGEKLMKRKETLENRSSFLEESLQKRTEHPFITKEEAEELSRSLNDDLHKTTAQHIKEFEHLLIGMKALHENGTKAMEETQQNGQAINELLKNGQYAYAIDGKISGFYSFLKRFIDDYELKMKQSIETLISKE